jgi:hypothetical protein
MWMFLVGLWVGCMLGIFTAALCLAAKDADERDATQPTMGTSSRAVEAPVVLS